MLEKVDFKEELAREPSVEKKTEIRFPEDAAEEYANRVRLWLAKLVEKYHDTDPHLGLTDPNYPSRYKLLDPYKLTHEDLIIADKFRKGELTVEEFSKYQKTIGEYISKLEKEGVSIRESEESPRQKFEAWVGNEMLINVLKKKHPDKYKPRPIDEDMGDALF